jgi:hypothetical protein
MRYIGEIPGAQLDTIFALAEDEVEAYGALYEAICGQEYPKRRMDLTWYETDEERQHTNEVVWGLIRSLAHALVGNRDGRVVATVEHRFRICGIESGEAE